MIIYLLLSRVLPFDDEDDREIARQTIYEPPDFSFSPWETVSKEGKEICKSTIQIITKSIFFYYRTSRKESSQETRP